MKRKLLMLALAAMAVVGGTVGAAEPQDLLGAGPRDLEELLRGGRQTLSREAIVGARGLPILAFEIWPELGTQHYARYVGGSIETGNSRDPNRQWVSWGEGEHYGYSESTSWRIEVIAGAPFLVHYHEGFRVFTRPDMQFVIAG